ncbi:hypothetical protein HanRHA438_Chr03g0143401 [Helianthus annuus]|nr:hypothetical protein HanRHA438_Chr03g0143401 [Helianthus annuus]
MASRCNRFINKASISNLKSAFRSASVPKSAPSSPKFPLPTASPAPRFSISRCPSELGCVQSLLPLHNAVAAARLTSCLSTTSRSCRSLSQAGFIGSKVTRLQTEIIEQEGRFCNSSQLFLQFIKDG